MGELSGVHNVLGAVMQFAVALCHSVVLQGSCNFGVFYTKGDDIRGLASSHCVLSYKALLFILYLGQPGRSNDSTYLARPVRVQWLCCSW